MATGMDLNTLIVNILIAELVVFSTILASKVT